MSLLDNAADPENLEDSEDMAITLAIPPPPPGTTISDLVDITPIPNKGLGVLAVLTIEPGTIILQEGTTMHIPVPAQQLNEEHLKTAFSNLSRTEKISVSSLSVNSTGTGSQLMRLFTSNTFGNGEACWLHPTISRINHSCSPNTTTVSDTCCIGDECQIIADRRIEAGEEITFSYNNELYEITTSAQRKALLQNQYGFQCDCVACAPGEFQLLSDMRRLLIRNLRERLDGLQTSDLENLEEEMWMKEVAHDPPPSAEQRTVWNLLLAGLREAEGLSALAVAQNYWRAAEALLEQIQAMVNIVVVAWARRVRNLMMKAIEVLDEVRSPFDHDPQTLREAWKAMQDRPCLKVAIGFMDGDLEVHVKGWHRSSAFAIEIVGGKLKVLSKDECSARLNGIVGTIRPVSQDDHDPGDIESFQTSRSPKASTNTVERISDAPRMVKVVGAALTCAAPIAAYWMMR